MTTSPMDSDATMATCALCGRQHSMLTIRFWNGLIVTNALCPECDDAQKRREREAHDRQRRDRLERAWADICPPRYRETDPARLPQDKLAQVMAWQYGPQGLLLIGPTDGSKTRCAHLLLRRLLDEGRCVRAFDCASFGHEVGRRFRDGTGEDWADELAAFDVVFLDDIGKVPFTERVEAELFALVERRTANMKPIIATMNMTGADLTAKTSADRGAPLVRRLREFCRVVVF